MKKKDLVTKNLMCCYGLSSKIGSELMDNIFMIDYDNLVLEAVTNHLRFIQKDYNLSDIYIIESSNGFNALSLDIMNLTIIYNIGIDVFSPADRDFFKYGYKRGYYVLRFDNDKRLVKILESDNKKYNNINGTDYY